MSRTTARAPRLLVVPGLRSSGPTHWQSWLQAQHRDARRVEQDDWTAPELDRWATRVAETLAGEDGPWIAVAHSFGCLALVRHLQLRPDSPVRAALLVAPAEPNRFDVEERLQGGPLGRPSTVVASDNDPWMSAASSRRWAQRWGSGWLTLGEAGHVNVESGFGPLPLARRWVFAMGARLARERRPLHASWPEWSLAV